MPLGVDTYIPFPSRISPDVPRAEAEHLAWPHAFGLLPTDRSVRRHLQGRFPELAGRFNPRAVGPELDLSTDQMSWFFIFDDMFDGPDGATVDGARALVRSVEAVLLGGPIDADRPIVAAFADLWRRSCEGMSQDWRRRAVDSWRTYLDGHVTEAAHRSAGTDPTQDAQIALRAETGGVRPILDLAERLGGYEIPDVLWYGSELTEMRQLAAEIVILDNDIVSLEKEERIGDHNLVLHLERDVAGGSRDTAIAMVCEMLRSRTVRFLQLAQELPELATRHVGTDQVLVDVENYLQDALAAVMRGAHDWQQHSERYRPEYLDLDLDLTASAE